MYADEHTSSSEQHIVAGSTLVCETTLLLQLQALSSGAITMTFGQKSDALSQDISAVVLHLYNSQCKLEATSGKAPALAAVTEVWLTTLYYVNESMQCWETLL